MTVFNLPRSTVRVHAHKLIVETAKEMAEELFEQLMLDNKRYAAWKKATAEYQHQLPTLTNAEIRRLFVNEMFPHLIEQARATLARLLATPINDHLKSSIHDALIKDTPLRAGRLRAMGRGKRQPLSNTPRI